MWGKRLRKKLKRNNKMPTVMGGIRKYLTSVHPSPLMGSRRFNIHATPLSNNREWPK